jgi:hypothetical protein
MHSATNSTPKNPAVAQTFRSANDGRPESLRYIEHEVRLIRVFVQERLECRDFFSEVVFKRFDLVRYASIESHGA